MRCSWGFLSGDREAADCGEWAWNMWAWGGRRKFFGGGSVGWFRWWCGRGKGWEIRVALGFGLMVTILHWRILVLHDQTWLIYLTSKAMYLSASPMLLCLRYPGFKLFVLLRCLGVDEIPTSVKHPHFEVETPCPHQIFVLHTFLPSFLPRPFEVRSVSYYRTCILCTHASHPWPAPKWNELWKMFSKLPLSGGNMGREETTRDVGPFGLWRSDNRGNCMVLALWILEIERCCTDRRGRRVLAFLVSSLRQSFRVDTNINQSMPSWIDVLSSKFPYSKLNIDVVLYL